MFKFKPMVFANMVSESGLLLVPNIFDVLTGHMYVSKWETPNDISVIFSPWPQKKGNIHIPCSSHFLSPLLFSLSLSPPYLSTSFGSFVHLPPFHSFTHRPTPFLRQPIPSLPSSLPLAPLPHHHVSFLLLHLVSSFFLPSPP